MAEYLVRASSPVISLSNPNLSDEEDNNHNHLNTPSNETLNPGAIVVSGDCAATTLIPTPSSNPSSRKPRGRPPGSKNKPKPPVVITRESDSAMRPVILELASGCDIVSTLSAFSLRRRNAVSVFSGTGAVSNVTIRHPSSPNSNIALHGRFELLSLTGTILLPTPSSSNGPNTGFAILVGGPQGQVIGGTVAGPLMTADTVMIMGAVYSAPEVHHLPFPVENEEADVSAEREVHVEGKVKVEATAHAQAPLYGGPVGMGGQMARPEMALWSQSAAPATSSRAGQSASQY
ncbi:AT-hook motif nuclear-localized protein 17 [Rhynchospora pubera]|uniref:AT-hook motif nuclear-localized protein n=1 Tax=Rhynchospora pubera TaxID=906938 RepID=A0AAV8F698_9POAL|nr:AT-hook motif nuclear-localized protein 17 [Rhynchospora pubera]KAJ4786293.1 AT-hook motif nuclear-localized protein 17 [Rhynchospora pubera]KAJ4804807.1 AT-hook motif nuclear-localized protein 17 [Rhynchospora pubera]